VVAAVYAHGIRRLFPWPTSRHDVEEYGDTVAVPGLVVIGELDQLLNIKARFDEGLGVGLQRTVLAEESHRQTAVAVRANKAFLLQI
jgi:hypothetical protein